MNGLMQHIVTWLFVICFACTTTLHLAVLYFVAFRYAELLLFLS